MFKFIKGIFSFNTDSVKYSLEVIKLLTGIIFVGIGLTLTELVFPNVLIIQILRGIFVFVGFEVLLSFMWRIDCVFKNKEKYMLKNKKNKFKHNPLYLPISDFIFLVKNAVNPETLYVESETGEFFIVQIAFDITGTRGMFYNKHFVIDEEEIYDEVKFLNKLRGKGIIYEEKIKVYALFDYNKPQILLSVINSLRNKK